MESVAHVAAAGFLYCYLSTICLMPYNHKYNVLSISLNKPFPSFFFDILKQLCISSGSQYIKN